MEKEQYKNKESPLNGEFFIFVSSFVMKNCKEKKQMNKKKEKKLLYTR